MKEDRGQTPIFFGSPSSGERGPDFEEEVRVIAKTVGHSVDDLDLLADAFDQVGSQQPAAVREDSAQVEFEPPGETLQRPDAASHRTVIPLFPEALGVTGMAIVPQRLQVILEHLNGEQRPVRGR